MNQIIRKTYGTTGLNGTSELNIKRKFFAHLPYYQATNDDPSFVFNYRNVLVFRFESSNTKQLVGDMNFLYNCVDIRPNTSANGTPKIGAVGFFDYKNSKFGKNTFRMDTAPNQAHLVIFPRTWSERQAIESRRNILTQGVPSLKILNHKHIGSNLCELLERMIHMFERDGFGKHQWTNEPIVFPKNMRSLDPRLTTTQSLLTISKIRTISNLLTDCITNSGMQDHKSQREFLTRKFRKV